MKLNNDNNTKLRKTNSLMMKSSSSIYNINENIDIVQEDPKKNFLFSKSKTIMGNVQNNKKLNVIPNLLNFNGHLDTVIETVSEVSNSKIGSKKLIFNSFRIINGCFDTEIASFRALRSETFSGLLSGFILRIGQSLKFKSLTIKSKFTSRSASSLRKSCINMFDLIYSVRNKDGILMF